MNSTLQTDVAIIGAGPGGYATALRAAELGKSVTLIERDAHVGGTCLLRGCIPSKALISAAHTMDAMNHAATMGIQVTAPSVDEAKLAQYREQTVTTMTSGLAELLAARHIQMVHGQAALQSDGTILVTPAPDATQVRVGQSLDALHDAGTQVTIQATDTVLATGGRPRPLPNVPFGGAVLDSTAALGLEHLPKRAAIVGAGSVALEFASMWRSMGAEVTLLVRHDTPLSHAHHRSAVVLTRELKRRGIKIVAHSQVTETTPGESGEGVHVTYTSSLDNETYGIDADVLLVAIGRDPNTDMPWMQDLDIDITDAGLIVTDDLGQTSMPHVWAVGDITPGHGLAHRAFEQGITIAEAIAGLNPKPVDERTIPSVIFTTPEFASVGRTVQEAQTIDGCTDVTETLYPVMGNARMVMERANGSMAVVTGCRPGHPDQREVLGVHIVAPMASELIGQAEHVLGAHTPLSDAARLIEPHPTFSEMFGEALLKADGRPFNTL
ncbi:dihydrolipoamide dehydrogenase [Bifidobacterium dolichotidis]|uniref:Dihydrolipoamide dehydrogenase n=1 Tax=Bifidobacterium dolichotidis TaxID=2306976 RepID=A0A430FTE6_9BIFI|nr:FAD-dependent oxidoreductase [Bifidobacterium dolichotidis]RSX56156.1 dihydrolipoamide dehydrogenase [Bifidobacterium dolichotidis]